MSNDQIVTISNYSPATDIMYAKVKVNPSGGKNIPILNSKMRKNTMLSTPLMLTWGMNEFNDEKTGKRSYELSLQFPNADYPDADGEVFLQKMREFEAKIKADAVTNCKDWFNKQKMSAEVVDALWTPMLKYPKNKESGDFDYTRAPTLRLKVPYWEGDWKIELYDMEQNQLWPSEEVNTPTDLIPKLTRVACVIQCGGIWFANGKFGVTWKLFQAVVKPPQSLRGKCHIRLTEGDKERMTKSGGDASASGFDDDDHQEHGDDTTGVAVQDSDDEADQSSAPPPAPVAVPEPQPAAAPVKKTIVRKKKASADDE
jgi:hypothetical protein